GCGDCRGRCTPAVRRVRLAMRSTAPPWQPGCTSTWSRRRRRRERLPIGSRPDRKDAELLVRLLLAGSLASVAVPSAESEAARDLARAREQVRADLARLRHRVSKLLLRYGRVYDGGGTWTQAHRRWLAAQRFE